MEQLTLSTGWQIRQRDPACALEADFSAEDGWFDAPIPGSVHEALIASNRLEDPFIGLNELGAQWVGESDWLYRCVFDVPDSLFDHGAIALCFDGLDTIATVWLNSVQVLVSDNMFVPQRVGIQELLRPGTNELRILFESAVRI